MAYKFNNDGLEVTASRTDDGRTRLAVFAPEWPRSGFNPKTYTTVKNIDGSDRFMLDSGGWTFFPWDDKVMADAATAALAKLS
jgi:hypothetical protein